MMSKKLLQILNAGIAILTIGLASLSLIYGVKSPVYQGANIPDLPTLDSNLRFFGGLGLGIGIALLWITPKIEKHTLLFRTIWLITLLGGNGRIVSMVLVDLPPTPVMVFTLIEVPLVPLLIYWQWKVSKIKDVNGD